MKKKLKEIFNKIKKYVIKTHKNVKYVTKKCNKFYLVILFDMAYSFLRYGVSQEEYKRFEFYKIQGEKRKTYLTIEKHYLYKRKLYRTKDLSFLKNKEKFYNKFNSFISREILNVNKISYKEYEELVKENNKLICSDERGSGFVLFDSSKFRSPAFMLEKIKKEKLFLVEKAIIPHKSFEKITDELVTLSIITVLTSNSVEILGSTVKFLEDGEELKGYVDYDEGVIKGSFRDNKGESYTKKNADGFKIPLLKEAIKLAKECAEATPDVREIEWNFCISSKKVYLMNANLWEDVMFLQTPEYLVRRNGILPRYKDMMFEIRG